MKRFDVDKHAYVERRPDCRQAKNRQPSCELWIGLQKKGKQAQRQEPLRRLAGKRLRHPDHVEQAVLSEIE
jgi:hypothetical protein